MSRAQTIHLLLEAVAHPGQSAQPRRGGSEPVSGDPAHQAWIEVPEGVSYLVVDEDGRPRLVLDPPEDTGELYLVEQVYRDHAPKLLVLNLCCNAPFVNAREAPPVVLLEAGDEVLFGSGSEWVSHVTVFSNAVAGPPPEKEIGFPCPVCLEIFNECSTTYLCSGCGKPYHLEPDEVPEEERFRCVSPGQKCSVCRTPMMESGYSFLPESFRGH